MNESWNKHKTWKPQTTEICEACATNEPMHVTDVQMGMSSLQVDNKQQANSKRNVINVFFL